MTQKAVIMGASSGMGLEVAKVLLRKGWTLGLAARRQEAIEKLRDSYPGQVFAASIDITRDDADEALLSLIHEMGGIDLYLHVSGIGYQNLSLTADKELRTVNTNGLGFTRMVGAAYRYFAEKGGGHIAAISSIAGTKGLGAAPAYSATKAFQNVYLQALEQQAHLRRLPIYFTDIRPGFVRTSLLDDGHHYPMLMDPHFVARRIVRAILHHRHVVVIDGRYRVLTFLWRLLPSWLWRRLNIKTKM
ncbi:MAG: SDR family NAD(P)-dependent oxidoreductase [Prevotellaceae bacterium]|nr:SDR family NAD(P)-dependent oxidoreductase [Prevotellaceae bacterium]